MRSTLNDRIDYQERKPLQPIPSGPRDSVQPLNTNIEFENLLGMIQETKKGLDQSDTNKS